MKTKNQTGRRICNFTATLMEFTFNINNQEEGFKQDYN